MNVPNHPGGSPGANVTSISHRCYPREVAFEWELTKETIYLPLGCLQGGGGGVVCEPDGEGRHRVEGLAESGLMVWAVGLKLQGSGWRKSDAGPRKCTEWHGGGGVKCRDTSLKRDCPPPMTAVGP